jgi:hypothetical protein
MLLEADAPPAAVATVVGAPQVALTGADPSTTAAVRLPTSFAVLLSLALSLALVVPGALVEPAHDQRRDAMSGLLRADMTTPHEARPHGVPAYWDWAAQPRLGNVSPPPDFTAFTAWGHLYRCSGTPFDRRMTAVLRDLQTWYLDGATGGWKRVQRSSDVGGSAFAEDYRLSPVAARVVARGRDGTSVRMRRGRNFHFWPGAGRVAFDTGSVSAVAVVVRAKLTGGRARRGCLTLGVGGDFWRSTTAPAVGSRNNMDAGIGRFKRVGRRWRAYTMTTASAGTLARHPLPLRLARRELR